MLNLSDNYFYQLAWVIGIKNMKYFINECIKINDQSNSWLE